ncbi:protein of unknown function [Shinella sp. WSC3-e]|nr:hypothetical protein SHINE37_41922 [Rhizobiaceae bacterium]CAK7256528.1 protein of unknown function [Shinella sp. WSC3-e]
MGGWGWGKSLCCVVSALNFISLKLFVKIYLIVTPFEFSGVILKLRKNILRNGRSIL